MAIAIDFGTSNTVIAKFDPDTQTTEVIKLPKIAQQTAINPELIPSLVYVKDAQNKDLLIGQKVRDNGLDIGNNQRFFKNFKRGIGSNIQGFLPQLDEQNITFEQVGEWFLSGILKELSEKPDSLIITVPVDSFESYRNWLTEVCQKWEIEQVRIIDEPTAAALGYETQDDDFILVVDFGEELLIFL